MSPTTDLQVFYTGKVQGVGFRYSVKQLAASYEVAGWVRNLVDGRVELQVSGEAAEIEAFLESISRGQLRSYIKQVERVPKQGPAERWSGFEIRV